VLGHIPVKRVECMIKGMELGNLFEEIEATVANLRVREVGDGGFSPVRVSDDWYVVQNDTNSRPRYN
jgi:hypothetical protein